MTEIELPDTPFARADAKRRGLTDDDIRHLLDDGEIRRITQGCYVPARCTDTPELRAAAVALVAPPDHVVTDRTAAWLHGIDVFTYAEHDIPPPIDTCAPRGRPPSERRGVDGRTRDLAARDIMVIHGIRVTTPLRTALDLGCVLLRREAMAALDAFCRRHGLTPAQLAREAQRFKRRRGVVQLRELIGLVDPRAESARESWTRLEIHDEGLPAPEPQVWINVDGVPTYRLDLAYRHCRVAIEYNGFDAHERAPEQQAYDRARLAWLRENGWTVIVVRRGDFTGEARDRWLRELRAALQPTYSNVRRMERNARLVRDEGPSPESSPAARRF